MSKTQPNIGKVIQKIGEKPIVANSPATNKIISQYDTADKKAGSVMTPPVLTDAQKNQQEIRNRMGGGTAQTPKPTPSTLNDGVPIWEEKGMTREEYIAQNNKRIQGEFDVKPKEGEVFDPYAALRARQMDGTDGAVSGAIAKGRADAIRDKIMEGVGEQPKGTDTSGMTKEEADAARLADAQALGDWWRKVGEKSQMELGDATVGIADVKNEISTYKESIDKMLANLNSVDPAAGTAIGDTITNYTNNGGTQITPEALAKIQQLGSQGLSPAELKVKVNAILNTPSQTQLNGAGITDTGDSFTMSNGVSFRKGADGLPDYSGENLPKDANAYDIALMELAVNNKIADTGLTQQIRLLKDLSEEVARATKTSKQEVMNTFDTASNKVDEAMLSAMNNMKYQERKLSLEKDISLDNILTNEAKMEGYLKGQMEAWGAEGSSAALTVMATTKNNFLKQYTQTALGYDIELSRVADLQTEASMAFTNRTIEIANAKALGLQQINDDLLTNIDNIFNKTSEAYENTDLKLMQNNLNYGKQVQAIKTAEQEAALKAAEATKKYNFDLMKEYADQTGYVYQIDKDGNVKPKVDSNGYPQLTLAGRAEKRLGDKENGSSGTFNPSGIGTGGGTSGGTGAVSLQMTTDYLNGLDPNWIANTGTGQVMTGSPWGYGLDIDGKIGDPVKSPVTGKVIRVESDKNGSKTGFGNNVLIETEDGKIIQFSHLDSTSVTVGQDVDSSTVLGALGNTGYVIAGKGGDGSHLDITMWSNLKEIKDKEDAIAGSSSELLQSSEIRPTGNTDVDTALRQIKSGALSLEDFPVVGGSADERQLNRMVHEAYSAQSTALGVPSQEGRVEIESRVSYLSPVHPMYTGRGTSDKDMALIQDDIRRGIASGKTDAQILLGYMTPQGQPWSDVAMNLFDLASGNPDINTRKSIGLPINQGKPVQAMNNLENSLLKTVDRDFSDATTMSEVVNRASEARELAAQLPNMTGKFDKKLNEFLIQFPASATDAQRQKGVRLASILTDISRGFLSKTIGKAMTESELRLLEPLITTMKDQPDTIQTKLDEMIGSVLNTHNAVRRQGNLPVINELQAKYPEIRLQLYRSPKEKT